MRVSSSHLTLADLELAPEILFTGKRPADPVAQVWSYSLARGTTAPWMVALRAGVSPPAVRIPMRFMVSLPAKRPSSHGESACPQGVDGI